MENEGAGCYAVADNGTMVYLAGGPERYQRQLVWVDRRGEPEVLPVPPRDYQSVTISPDGSRAIVQVMEAMTGLWLYDFARHTMTPLSTSGGSSQAPVWTPDGARVIYRGTRSGSRNLWWRAADGTGNEERLTTRESTTQTPTSVSPDGEWLVYNDAGERTQGNGGVWRIALHGEREPMELVQTPPAFSNGRISPDGKWMAYVSAAVGTTEIYIQPFPGPGASRQVSNGGGDEPLWSRNGRELFYLNGSTLMAVDVSAGSTLVIGQPRVLFEGRYRRQINGNTAYDVSLDGQRFLRIRQVTPEPAEDHLEVVLNWIDQLERLVAAK
jgi:serine/threonine-protein kinase